MLCEVSIKASCYRNCTQVKSVTMFFGFFSVPYANLDSVPIVGYLYNPDYENTSNSCNSVLPPPPPPAINRSITFTVGNDTYTFNFGNTSSFIGSILLLSNYSHCMLERLLLARAVGYDMILSYTEDDTNTTITESIINTGFPIALVQYKHLQTILGWVVLVNNTRPNTWIVVTVDTSWFLVVVGVFFAIIFTIGLFVLVGFLVSWCINCCEDCCENCCKNCCEKGRDSDSLDSGPLPREDGSHYRSRQGHVESIELQVQVPLERDGIDKERETTCCICLDNEKNLKPGQEVRELPCQHRFHTSCIDEWLSHNSICPLCRQDLSGEQ